MLRWLHGRKALIALVCCFTTFFSIAKEHVVQSIQASHDLNWIRIWQTVEGNNMPLYLTAQPNLIHLSPFDSNVRFRFQLFGDHNALYRLVGHDSQWQPIANGMTVLCYSALPTGHYRLEVQISSSQDKISKVYSVTDIWVTSTWGRTSGWLIFASVTLIVCWRWVNGRILQKMKHRDQFDTKEAEREKSAEEIQTPLSLLTRLTEECQTSLMLMASIPELQQATTAVRGFERLQGLVRQLNYYATEKQNTNVHIPIVLRSWLLPRLDWYCNQAELKREMLSILMIPDAIVTLDNELLDQCLNTLISKVRMAVTAKNSLRFLCMLEPVSGMLVSRIMYCTECGFESECENLTQDVIPELLLQRLTMSDGRCQRVKDDDGSTGWELRLPASWHLLQQGTIAEFSQLSAPISPPDAPNLLIVESDPDMSHLLLSWLGDKYRVLFSASIHGAIARTKEESMDLVLCTAHWLPDGDTCELLSLYKMEPETCHIPFILCCADSDSDSEANAWQALADDFLPLPLTPKILSLRLQALLENRQRIRTWLKEYLISSQSNDVNRPETSIPPKIEGREGQFSDELYSQAHQLLEQGALSLETLAARMNLGGRTLQRKLQLLLGMNYSDYVRKIQMQLVVKELNKGSSIKTAARVAGFRDQAYLTRVFRQTFDMSPTEYRNHHLTQSEDLT